MQITHLYAILAQALQVLCGGIHEIEKKGEILITAIEPASRKVAILYQVLPAPIIDGVKKPPKEGGYSDSGADIAFTLKQAGIDVLTPASEPNASEPIDWVFPDTQHGIDRCLAAGVGVLWANTVLFDDHPLGALNPSCMLVGQIPGSVQRFDDKWYTNSLLASAGLPVARSLILSSLLAINDQEISVAALSPRLLEERHLRFPLIVKPIRGRGSQGVVKTDDFHTLQRIAEELLSAGSEDGPSVFGTKLMIEEYLPGQEITITVMPAGRYGRRSPKIIQSAPWALPPVIRFNHRRGIAPYNGEIAVVENSMAMSQVEASTAEVEHVLRFCEMVGFKLGIRAPIRIDCRQNAEGVYRIFDVNLKPNMTGRGRPGRENQDSLVALASREIGWSYSDLLLNMLDQAW